MSTRGFRRRNPEEIDRQLSELEKQRFVEIQTIGKSVEGQDLRMVAVTDKDVPDENKQVALLVSGEHGDEPHGVAGMMDVLDWLTSKDAEEVRKRQLILVVPLVNPDGYRKGAPMNSNGVDIYREYDKESGPTQPEDIAVWQVAERYVPDIVVCVHGARGAGDLGYNTMDTRPENETIYDSYVHQVMANAAIEKAREQGLSVHRGVRNTFVICNAAYQKFHSLCFGMHSAAQATSIRVKALLQFGNMRWPSEPPKNIGYPNNLIRPSGLKEISFAHLCAVGDTAAKRRLSRAELWSWRKELSVVEPVPAMEGSHIVLVYRKIAEPWESYAKTALNLHRPIRYGAGLRVLLPMGSKVTGVQFNGDDVESDRYVAWNDEAWTYVQIDLSEGWRFAQRGIVDKFADSTVIVKYKL